MSAVLAFEVAAWMLRAACRPADVDAKLFFPQRRHSTAAAPAKAFCRRCPVRTQCLDYALSHERQLTGRKNGHRHGVWGGTNPTERQQIFLCRARLCGHTDRSRCRLGSRSTR
jgi:WhiB family redox-sensing transcriptional regulator